jgi:uncharacterized protein (TIGR01370 family)
VSWQLAARRHLGGIPLKSKIFKWIFLMAPALLGTACTGGGGSVKTLFYYGEGLSQQHLTGIDLAVVEPDRVSPANLAAPHTRFTAYVSVGEVNDSRPYFNRLRDAGTIVEENENWLGAHRIDVRSPVWRALLLDEILPGLFRRDFQGVFLDTVDTAAFLEGREPGRFKGAKAALVALVKEIKRRYPDRLLLVNNALDHLSDYGDVIDGVVVEDLYTVFDFDTQTYRKTLPENDHVKEALLDAFRHRTGKPVIVILYALSDDDDLVRYGSMQSRAKGYQSTISDVGLSRLPRR